MSRQDLCECGCGELTKPGKFFFLKVHWAKTIEHLTRCTLNINPTYCGEWNGATTPKQVGNNKEYYESN